MSTFINTTFVFNGVKSEDLGIHLIKPSGGFLEGQFFAEREIVSEMIPGNHTPYIFGERRQPLRFSVHLSPLEGTWTSELKSLVSRWLNNGKFNEFYSTDDLNRRYFVTYIGSPTLHQSGNMQGWIEVEFLNIDCYVRSPVHQQLFEINNGYTIIEIENIGDTLTFPKVWIRKIGQGDLKIRSISDGGRTFEIRNLKNNEVIFVDNKNRMIETNIPDRYLYDQFNDNYLSLVYGVNRLEVIGNCKLKFEYQYEFLST